MDSRELDALIEEHVFNRKVVCRNWPCERSFECSDLVPCRTVERRDNGLWYGKWGTYERHPVRVETREEVVKLLGHDDVREPIWPPVQDDDDKWLWADVVIVPHYSTDIADAWQVVETIRKQPFPVRHTFGKALQQVITKRIAPNKAVTIAPETIWQFMEPQDICLAALKAYGVDVETEVDDG